MSHKAPSSYLQQHQHASVVIPNAKLDFDDDQRDRVKMLSCFCGVSNQAVGQCAIATEASGLSLGAADLMQCRQCRTWQHKRCVGAVAASEREYECPDCEAARPNPLPIKATLIICPPAILQQWRNEIELHVSDDSLKVLLYDGVCGANRVLHGTDQRNALPTVIRPHDVRERPLSQRDYSINERTN